MMSIITPYTITLHPAGDSVADTSTSCKASVKAGHVHQLRTLGLGRTRPPGRRSRLPRIRPETLEEPDFVQVAANPARPRRGREAVEAVGVVPCIPLAPKNLSRAPPCPPVGAFGHRGWPLVDVFG